MNFEEKIELTKQNIRTAIEDYWKHNSYNVDEIKNNISEDFIDTLAKDAYYGKQNLRIMLRKSPAWNEELDAIVMNGNTTHEPDYNRIYRMAVRIVEPALEKAEEAGDKDRFDDIYEALNIFSYNSVVLHPSQIARDAMERIAPHAYVPGKKMSRVFKAFCVALGIADETPNSQFQRDFAKIADEMSSRKISFKLFLSINPAHFITMSNPKCDDRGSCLTSCHSFNSDEYDYNNGCTGYARDDVTMIAFTVSDPDNSETLNNRKTTRQLFMYEPNNGVLLQSRMYNTSGGTHGAQAESELYRDLVQRQIALCEEASNNWVKCNYYNNKFNLTLYPHDDFGGYADWDYEEFNPILSIRKDHLEDFHPFIIGAPGLCIACGEETCNSDGLLCEECKEKHSNTFVCDCCGERFPADEAMSAYDEDGNSVSVCEDCLSSEYSFCEDCECYYPVDNIHRVHDENGNDRYVCEDCCDRNYEQCDECLEWFQRTYSAHDRYGNDCDVCQNCLENNYSVCDECDETFHYEYMSTVYEEDGEEGFVCHDCRDDEYTKCQDCGQYHHKDFMCEAYDRNGEKRIVCQECLDTHYTECEECGGHYENDCIIDGLCPICQTYHENDEEENNDTIIDISNTTTVNINLINTINDNTKEVA